MHMLDNSVRYPCVFSTVSSRAIILQVRTLAAMSIYGFEDLRVNHIRRRVSVFRFNCYRL